MLMNSKKIPSGQSSNKARFKLATSIIKVCSVTATTACLVTPGKHMQ